MIQLVGGSANQGQPVGGYVSLMQPWWRCRTASFLALVDCLLLGKDPDPWPPGVSNVTNQAFVEHPATVCARIPFSPQPRPPPQVRGLDAGGG